MISNQPGALLDTRPAVDKEKDYRFEELVTSAAPVVWREKKQSEWRKFPISDQDGSGSCVAQTMKKIMGVYIWLKTNSWVALSASHIYQRRVNKPNGGMGGVNAFDIARQGVTLEAFAPSEKLNDSQMDNVDVKPFMDEVGKVFKIGNYVTVPAGNIDLIASIIQETGKAVMVWFYFSDGLKPREWTDVPTAVHKITVGGSTTARHSVSAVDFTLYKGQKALIIEDSWGLDAAMAGQRVITEDFFKARNWFAAYFINFAFEDGASEPATTKPRFNFLRDLEFSAAFKTETDVIALQNVLKYEGLFPANVESTGYFGSVTKKAVEQLQLKYGIATAGSNGFGRVGPMTRAWLNNKYN